MFIFILLIKTINNMKEYKVKVYDDRTEWYQNGKLHREDGPAVEWANGNKSWWVNNKLHREDGPAIEWVNGDKAWWLNGKLHREDGPAIEWVNGDKEWYLNGEKLTEQEFNRMNSCEGKEVEIDGKTYILKLK